MSEVDPQPRERFLSSRDEVLWTLSTAGWCQASSGDKAASTGWFAWISIARGELEEVFGVVEDEVVLCHKDQLLGHFLVVESTEGVTVNVYDDEAEAKRHFAVMQDAYEQWRGEQS